MSEELENKNESLSAGQNESSREGYKQTEGFNNQRGDRPMRPRIRVQRAYTPNHGYNKEEGGFRPEGFGAGLQQQNAGQRTYRPRYNAGHGEGGYQPRQGGYQPRQSYQPRHTIIRKGKRAISRANSNTANARRRGIVHDTPKTRRAATSRVSSNTANARKPVTVRVTTPDKVKADTSHVSRAINAADTSATSTDSRAKGDTTARADTASERLITTRMLNTA